MTFEPVRPTTHNATSEPELSLYPELGGRLNAEADREWFEDHDDVTLYIDEDKQLLGIKPGEHDGAVRTLSRSDSPGADVAVRVAVAALGLSEGDLEETAHLGLEWNDDHELVVADVGTLLEDTTTDDGDGDDDEEEYFCRECGDGPFDSETGRNIHEGRVHDGDGSEEDETEDDNDDQEADAGATHGADEDQAGAAAEATSPNGTAADRVERAMEEEGVTSVQELAQLLEISEGDARQLAREADRYMGKDGLRDRPSGGVRA